MKLLKKLIKHRNNASFNNKWFSFSLLIVGLIVFSSAVILSNKTPQHTSINQSTEKVAGIEATNELFTDQPGGNSDSFNQTESPKPTIS